MSLTIRFAGVTNNANFELRHNIGGRRESKVTIAVTLESGDRKMADFESNVTLWDVILGTVGQLPVEAGFSVVCVYMRKEVVGESDLKATTLRSLGLIGGRAAVRVFVREADVLGGQAHVENLIMKRKAPEVTYTPSVSKLDGNEGSSVRQESQNVPVEMVRKEVKIEDPVPIAVEHKTNEDEKPEVLEPEVPVLKYDVKREVTNERQASSSNQNSIAERMDVHETEPEVVEETGSLDINWVRILVIQT